MSRSVNLYELMNRFWKENDYVPFAASAIALFFFLLDRANSRHWKMPVKCPTALVCRAICVSKQTVTAAREALMKRGLISFSRGTGKDNLPAYVIVTDPEKWTESLTDRHTESLTGDLTDNSTGSLTGDLTPDLTQYNIKDKNIKNKISSIYKSQEEKKILSLEELEELFLSDKEWQDNLISLLSEGARFNEDTLRRQISYFFQIQKCGGTDCREEKECRTHFINWIKKQSNTNINGISASVGADKRRGAPVTATSADDYDGPF